MMSSPFSFLKRFRLEFWFLGKLEAAIFQDPIGSTVSPPVQYTVPCTSRLEALIAIKLRQHFLSRKVLKPHSKI